MYKGRQRESDHVATLMANDVIVVAASDNEAKTLDNGGNLEWISTPPQPYLRDQDSH